MDAINTKSSRSRERRDFEARRSRRSRHSCPLDGGLWRLIVEADSGSGRCDRPLAPGRCERSGRRPGRCVAEGVRRSSRGPAPVG